MNKDTDPCMYLQVVGAASAEGEQAAQQRQDQLHQL